MERLTLCAEAGSWPFWDDDDVGAVDPESLGLPSDLIADINAWTLRLDRVDGWIDDAQDRLQFDADGRALWRRIVPALDGRARVSYRETLGKASEAAPP